MADPYDYDLGEYRRTVSTSSPGAQTWFGRGLLWSYAFNHEEAAACFERATAADPECAMAHWGLAYALGPNYNKPWEFFDEDDLRTTVEQTHDAVERALALVDRAEPVEQALIRALEARYPSRVAVEDCSIWNAGYAEAMQGVYAQFSDDLDVATLYADALMNLTPWQLWDIRTGEPAPDSRAVEARDVLDRALELPGGARHPGLLHMYVHLMEMSSTPEQALRVADRLRGLVPDGGHLQHMPSHLDVLCGNYKAAMDANAAAVAADERFFARSGPMNFYTLYRAHNLHFLIYAAMFLGQSQVALETVDRLESSIPEELLRVESPPMADWLEGFLAMRVHALIRFGRWDDLLALELPSDPQLYCVTRAMTHYAHGVAYAATGRISEAEEERAMFRQAVKTVVPTRTLFNNTCLDILGVAAAMLDGEVAYRKGDFEEAFEHLRLSIDLDDQLPYDEPWGWMQPTRHAYGALLLEQGRVEEAATVYAADLGLDAELPRPQQHPNNVWSLHGYQECLVRLDRTAEASIIGRQLTLAKAMADVPIEASCFCRLEAFEHASPSAAGESSCCSGARHDH